MFQLHFSGCQRPQLPWARFAARSFPHLGHNLNETGKDSPHVETKHSIEGRRRSCVTVSFFLCQDLGSWGECVVKIFEMCCEDFEMCCEDFEMCCDDFRIFSEFKMCFEELGMCCALFEMRT